jgi:hypothetical protein
MNYQENIVNHYSQIWLTEPKIYIHHKGPFEAIHPLFRILEFEPVSGQHEWIYATVCMSSINDLNPIELHFHSATQDKSIIELLTAIAYYHINTARLDLGHTLNFGRPWQNGSKCEFGLLSLPYLDGPVIENLEYSTIIIKHYWLVPITLEEKEYKNKFGLEQLESRFEEQQFNYLDPNRASVV